MIDESPTHALAVSSSAVTENGNSLALPNDPERRLKILQAAQALRESREQQGESSVDPAIIRKRIRVAVAKELEPLEEQLVLHRRIKDAAEAKITELERLKAHIAGQPISELLAEAQ